MFPITVDQLAQLLGASSSPMTPSSLSVPQLRDVGEETLDGFDRFDESSRLSPLISAATIDTRTLPGFVPNAPSAPAFFAIPGEKTHGAAFAFDALSHGAACVVTDRPITPVSRGLSVRTRRRDPCILEVPSSVDALQTLGQWNRQQFAGLTIGITGSVGKTTTRQMIHNVLMRQFSGLQSPRNFNNEVGVPLTLCDLQPDHDFCVVEMGAGQAGDIAALARLAEPEFGVVTRVAPAHLASFGTIDDVRRTKQELIESLPAHGHAFLNADDPLVRSMANACRSEVTLFGATSDADIRADQISFRSGLTRFAVDGVPFVLRGGPHLVTCALAAAAVGRVTGISLTEIADAIEAFQPDAGRGRVVATSPWTVIDDSYNASPASVAACVGSLASWSTTSRRILVLGDMLELGDQTESLHFDAGRLIAQAGIAHTLLFGQFADIVAAGAKEHGLCQNRLSVFRDMETLKLVLDCLLRDGDVIWIKGSRSVAMERVVQHLLTCIAPSHLRAA